MDISHNKYVCQIRDTEVTIDIKEQIWLPDDKYL